LQEFWAGTNPTDNNSILRCLAIVTSSKGTTIYWSAVPNRTYRVESKSSLEAGSWQTLVDAVIPNSATGAVIDNTASLSAMKFYRVVALP